MCPKGGCRECIYAFREGWRIDGGTHECVPYEKPEQSLPNAPETIDVGKIGWDGRVAVTEATGQNITVDGKTYALIGKDANGTPVYQDVEVLASEAASEKTSKTTEEAENAMVDAKTDEKIEVENNKQNDKMVKEIKAVGGFAENATVHIPPLQVMVGDLDFDDVHINGERGHNVSREMAETWIQESKASVTVWNGQFEKYYGVNGVVYVDRVENRIRTAFDKSEFDERTRRILEVLKNGD